MSATDATAELSPPPAPPQDERTKPVPPYIANVLILLHVLLGYGRHLTLTLERRSTIRGFSNIAQFFGTARVPAMLARVARGLLRIQALQRVLLDRARRGRDLDWLPPRKYRPRPAKPAAPQIQEHQAEPQAERPAPVRRPNPEAIPDPDNLPTLEQLEAEIRRHGIGRAIADICLDFGVAPELCYDRFGVALLDVIQWYRGNQRRFLTRFYRRKTALDPELDGTPPLRVPERSWDAMKRALGFAIGERWPVMPLLLPAAPIAHAATGPP